MDYKKLREIVLRILKDNERGLLESSLYELVVTYTFKEPDNSVTHEEVRDALQTLEFGGYVERSISGAIRRGMTPHEKFLDAIRHKEEKVVRRFLQNDTDSEMLNAGLISAVINNRVEIVRLLLEAGADRNYQEPLFGKTSLQYVGSQTSSEITRLLESNE
jgi:ankyrin repeat protein